MKRLSNLLVTLGYFLLASFTCVACSNKTLTGNSGTPGGPTPSPTATPQKLEDPKLTAELERIATAARGRVGLAAVVLETGESVSLRPSDRFPMQSVYKLPIAMAVLAKVDQGGLKLDQRVKIDKSTYMRPGQHSPIRDRFPNGAELSLSEVLRFAVSLSDGTASDVLLELAGGPAAAQAYLKELGVLDLIIANSEKEIGQDWETQYRNYSTPEASVALLRALHEGRGISQGSRRLLLKWMLDSPTGPGRLKGLLPRGAAVAHKTGSSGTENGISAATNDIGIITLPNGKHLAIAVFVSDSPAEMKVREGVIAQLAKALWDKWGR